MRLMKMDSRKPRIPTWFDDAVAWKAEGLSLRQIRKNLASQGVRVSITTIWHWVTPLGQADLQKKYTPEKREEHRLYMREYMRAKKLRDDE